MTIISKNWNSTLETLEKKIADFAGTQHAVICNSGRAAIFYSLRALRIKHSDEVVVPDYSSQILPITVFCTGATPKFCDIDRKTLALSPKHLLKVLSPNTKAIIFVPPYGMPVDPSPILEITREKKIAFITDAAQALGTKVDGKMVASFGDVGILSFNKFLDAPSGAAAVTDRQELADKIKIIRENYEKRSLFAAINYRIMELMDLRSKKVITKTFWRDNYFYRRKTRNAKKYFQIVNEWVNGSSELNELRRSGPLPTSIIIQLWGSYGGRYYYRRRLERLELLALESEFESLQKYLNARKINAQIYEKCLKKDFGKFIIPAKSEASYLRYPILFSDKKNCSICLNKLINEGFKMYYYYEPLHTSPFFSLENRDHKFPESIYVADHLLLLPVDSNLSNMEIERIVTIVNSSTDL